jgi:hypothetical protein
VGLKFSSSPDGSPLDDDGMDIAKETFVRLAFCKAFSIQIYDTIHNIPDKVINCFFYS